MTRDRTHYVGDDCQPAHAELPITENHPGERIRPADAAAAGWAGAVRAWSEVDAEIIEVVPDRPEWLLTDDDIAAVAAATERPGAITEAIAERFGPRSLQAVALATAFRPGGVVARAVADELDRIASNLGRIRPIHGTELADLAAEWREGRR